MSHKKLYSLYSMSFYTKGLLSLPSLVMKNFERIVKDEIISLTGNRLDPLQFAYQTGKSVDDAKIFILDKIYKHLEKPSSHASLLFTDSSAILSRCSPLFYNSCAMIKMKLSH